VSEKFNVPRESPQTISSENSRSGLFIEHYCRPHIFGLGKCIRVNYDFWLLVRRLHIICYRETELPTSLLLPALLTRFKKRYYTSYSHVRSNCIWHSREDYLQYEKALALSQLLEELGELTNEEIARSATKTCARQKDQFVAPAPPGHGHQVITPVRTPNSVSTRCVSITPSVKNEDDALDGNEIEEDIIKPQSVITKDHRIKKQLDDWIFPKWQEYVAIETDRDTQAKSPGLERFQTGKHQFIFVTYEQKLIKHL